VDSQRDEGAGRTAEQRRRAEENRKRCEENGRDERADGDGEEVPPERTRRAAAAVEAYRKTVTVGPASKVRGCQPLCESPE
jgi:hypothetical protein